MRTKMKNFFCYLLLFTMVLGLFTFERAPVFAGFDNYNSTVKFEGGVYDIPCDGPYDGYYDESIDYPGGKVTGEATNEATDKVVDKAADKVTDKVTDKTINKTTNKTTNECDYEIADNNSDSDMELDAGYSYCGCSQSIVAASDETSLETACETLSETLSETQSETACETLSETLSETSSDTSYEASSNVLLKIEDRRGGGNNIIHVTQAHADMAAMPEGVSYNFTGVNLAGTRQNFNNVRGILLEDLFCALNITLLPQNLLQFVAFDDFGGFVRWDYLTAPRYYFPNQRIIAGVPGWSAGLAPEGMFTPRYQVPVIIAEQQNGRLMLGQRAPHEQAHNLFFHSMLANPVYPAPFGQHPTGRIILMDGNNNTLQPAAAVSPASGSTVVSGTEVTFTAPGFFTAATGFLHYTTDGTDPTYSSALFNHNMLGMGNTLRPIIRVEDADASGRVTLKTRAFGAALLPSEISVFYFYIEGFQPEPGPTDKLPQSAPTGLLGEAPATQGGLGRIAGTTTAMEFAAYNAGDSSNCDNSSDSSDSSDSNSSDSNITNQAADTIEWSTCYDYYTEVPPGQYRVRYAETDTHAASVPVLVSVPAGTWPGGGSGGTGGGGGGGTGGGSTGGGGGGFPEDNNNINVPTEPPEPPPGPVGDSVLDIYNGSVLVREFTQECLDDMPRVPPFTISAMNTWPSPRTYHVSDAIGIIELLEEAGVPTTGNVLVTFFARDGFHFSVTLHDLARPRFFFSDGVRGQQVPAVLSFEMDLRLLFGQLSAQDQITMAFVRDVDRIVVGGPAGSWNPPSVYPPSGSTVSEGDPIRLTMPGGFFEAKVFYTFDETTPTEESYMFNVTGDQWLAQRGMEEHLPILAPSSGAFTITARTMGVGRADSQVVRFYFNNDEEDTAGGHYFRVDLSEETLVATITEDDLTNLILEAAESGILELHFEVPRGVMVTSAEIRLPQVSIGEMIEAGINYLLLHTPLGRMDYDALALEAIYGRGGEDGVITFIIRIVDGRDLSGTQWEYFLDLVSGKKLFQIQVLVDDVPVYSFGEGLMTLRLYYELAEDRTPLCVRVWHINNLYYETVLTELESSYKDERGYVMFSRRSNSLYLVGTGPVTGIEVRKTLEYLGEIIRTEKESLTIDTPFGTVVYDPVALWAIYEQTVYLALDYSAPEGSAQQKEVVFKFSRIFKAGAVLDEGQLAQMDQTIEELALTGSIKLFQLQASLEDSVFTTTDHGQLTFRLFYQVQDDENLQDIQEGTAQVVVWYIRYPEHSNEDFVLTKIESFYNHEEGYVEFTRIGCTSAEYSFYIMGLQVGLEVMDLQEGLQVGLEVIDLQEGLQEVDG